MLNGRHEENSLWDCPQLLRPDRRAEPGRAGSGHPPPHERPRPARAPGPRAAFPGDAGRLKPAALCRASPSCAPRTPPPPEAGPRSQGGEAGSPPRSPFPASPPQGRRPAHTQPPRGCQLPFSQTPLRSLPEGLFLEEAPTQKERGPEPSRRPGGRRRPAVTSLVPARHARAHILGDRNKHGCEIKNERESNLINRP